MFKEKFTRKIILLSFAILLIFPLYNIIFAYPSFISALKEDVKEESIRTANHLLSLMKLSGESLQYKPETIEAVKKSFNLIKIKVFSPSGKTTYSTDPKDLGKINQNKIFHEIVAKGGTYVKIVEKNTKSLEGQLMAVDNVETYVPIMNNGKFLGAFEIYYDVTERKERFNKLRKEATVLVIVLACGLFGLVLVTSYKAKRTITAHRKTEVAIQKAKNEWEMTFDNASELIALVDKDATITRCNNSFAEFFGRTPKDLISLHYTDLKPFDHEQLKLGMPKTKIEIMTESENWLYVSYCPIIDKEGEFLKALLIATDITALKYTREKLIKSEKELTKRVADLEKFYDMAVGRELKMKELKGKIEQLKSELSQYKK